MRISYAALALCAAAAAAALAPSDHPAPAALPLLHETSDDDPSDITSGQQSDTTTEANTTPTSVTSSTFPTTPRSSSSCPGGCECYDGLQKEYTCANGTLELVLQPKEYLHIICHNSVSPPDPPPALPPQAVPSISVTGCGAPGGGAGGGGWGGYLQALGARGVSSLTLRSPPRGAPPLLPEHLRGLPEVTALSLVSAAPARLPAGLLAALPRLRRLKVRGGFGGGEVPLELSADTFAQAPQLEQLEVSLGAVAVAADAFRGLRALRRLGVWAAGLRALPPGALAGLGALQTLELRGNLLTALPAETLAGLGALQNVSLADNALAAVPAPALATLPAARLLDLSRNRITALRARDFAPLSGLRSLLLDGNRIQELSDGVFEGLLALEELSLRSNGLRLVSERAFLGTPALRRLALDDNQLTLADPDLDPAATAAAGGDYWNFGRSSPFQSLRELRELSLQRNQVSRVSPDWRLVLLRLRRLDLSHNHLRALSDADVNFLSPNIEVDMRYNNITTVELSPPLPAEALEGGGTPGESGATVLLDHNPLFCDCRLVELARRVAAGGAGAARSGEPRLQAGAARCAGPPALAQHALSDVPLGELACSLPAGECPAACRCTLRPAADALELECASAPMEAWPEPRHYGVSGTALRLLATPRPPSLSALELPAHTHTLRLRALNLSALAGAPPRSLALLDLRDNLLAAAPRALLAPDMALRLQIAGNPLRCDCDHAEDLLLLQQNSDRVDEWSSLRCERGEGASEGAPLVVGGVSPQALCATRLLALRLGAVLAALAALAALAGALCWRHRLLVRALCAARCPAWCRSGCGAGDGDEDKEKEYDAFVSYSHADEEWVLGTLVARLERAGRRLCVHCRDWVPGELIPAQIERSVRRSRRTLVVLSPAYLRSAWAREEWRAACGGSLLVVLLGVVRREELSAELRAHLAANTYVKVGDPWLWEKLLYALPARARVSAPATAPTPAPAEARLTALQKGFDDRIEGLGPPTAPAPAGLLCARLTPAGLLVNDAKLQEQLQPDNKLALRQ